MSRIHGLHEIDRYIDEIHRLRVMVHAVASIAENEGDRIYFYLSRMNQ